MVGPFLPQHLQVDFKSVSLENGWNGIGSVYEGGAEARKDASERSRYFAREVCSVHPIAAEETAITCQLRYLVE